MNKYLEEEIEEIEEFKEEEKRFAVTDVETANYCFRKIMALKQKRTESLELAAKEVERIHSWTLKETKGYDDSIAFFEGLLKVYYKEQKEQDGKFKLSTPYGKIVARKQQPKYEILDAQKAINYMKESGRVDLVRTKEEIDLNELKKVFKSNIDGETGEILDFLSIKEQEDSITIKVD